MLFRSLVGNVPPRDVLANGKPDDVEIAVMKACNEIISHEKIIWSAGGGMPPGVKNQNISAFRNAVKKHTGKAKF